MVYSCVAGNCTNIPSDSITLFGFPREPALRAEWTQQVQKTRPGWAGPSEYSRLCNKHFKPDQLEATPAFYKQFGINYFKKFALKPDAVPSIFPPRIQRRRRQQNGRKGSVKIQQVPVVLQDGPADSLCVQTPLASLPSEPKMAPRPSPTKRPGLYLNKDTCSTVTPRLSRPTRPSRLASTVKLGHGEKRSSKGNRRKDILTNRIWLQEAGPRRVSKSRFRRPRIHDTTPHTVKSRKYQMQVTQAHFVAQNTTPEPPSTSANMEYEPGQSVFDVKSSSTQLQSFIDQIYGESQFSELQFEHTETCTADIFDSSSTFLGSACYQSQNSPVDESGHHVADDLQTSSPIVIQCLLCDKVFSGHKAFKAHCTIKHGGTTYIGRGQGIKVVKCVTCKKSFTENTSLLKHIRNIHGTNRSKWFACKYCYHLFRNMRIAKEHEHEVHRNEMFLECKYCGQTFNSSHVFYAHVRAHSAITVSSSFQKKREKHSASVKLVKMSMLSEKQTVGELTPSASRRLFLDNRKIRVKPSSSYQSGPFQCKSCPRSFRSPHELLAHLTVHSDSGSAGTNTGSERKTKHNVPNILRR